MQACCTWGLQIMQFCFLNVSEVSKLCRWQACTVWDWKAPSNVLCPKILPQNPANSVRIVGGMRHMAPDIARNIWQEGASLWMLNQIDKLQISRARLIIYSLANLWNDPCCREREIRFFFPVFLQRYWALSFFSLGYLLLSARKCDRCSIVCFLHVWAWLDFWCLHQPIVVRFDHIDWFPSSDYGKDFLARLQACLESALLIWCQTQYLYQ